MRAHAVAVAEPGPYATRLTTLRSEAPLLRKLPSDYVHERFYFGTQPIEAPKDQRHMRALMDMIASKDRAAAGRAMQAMMQMKKLDLATLQRAFDEK